MEWTQVFGEWLKDGKEDSETLLGVPYDVEIKKMEGSENELIVASHPKIPFNIEVLVSKHYANLVINMNIPTDDLGTTEKMRVYKKLLHLNTDLNLMKAGLIGYDDQVVIQVDLDLASVSRHEFNDALTLLIVGAQSLIKLLDLTKEMEEFMLERFKTLVATKISDGESKDQILDFLVNRGGLDSKDAEKFLDEIYSRKEVEEDRSKDSGPGPMYG